MEKLKPEPRKKVRDIIMMPDWKVWLSRGLSALLTGDVFILTSDMTLYERLSEEIPLLFIGLTHCSLGNAMLDELLSKEELDKMIVCVTADIRNQAYFFVGKHKEHVNKILIFDPVLTGQNPIDAQKWILRLLSSEFPGHRLLGMRERAMLVHEHLLSSDGRKLITVDELYKKYCEIFWMEAPPDDKEEARGKSRKTDFLKALALNEERLDVLYDRHLKKLETKKFLNRQLLHGYAEKLLKCIKSP